MLPRRRCGSLSMSRCATARPPREYRRGRRDLRRRPDAGAGDPVGLVGTPISTAVANLGPADALARPGPFTPTRSADGAYGL